MPFTADTLRFLRGIKAHNNKLWFEAHRAEYEEHLREPMRELVVALDARFPKYAPEMTGDPKRSMFRINRDIRFSRDKSPYKTNAACWFYHRQLGAKTGVSEGASAGFYFHLEPGKSFVGGGLWRPPSDQLKRLREAIAEDPRGFDRMARGLVRRFKKLDDNAMLKRMPQGYPETHPAAKWLKYQSFTTGRGVTDAQVTSARLAGVLEREFAALLPLVRWLNGALGLPATSR